MKKVTAFAPATVANVFMGFDILGFAVEGIGDRVSISLSEEQTRITEIRGNDTIPKEIHQNTAGKAVISMIETLDLQQQVAIEIEKGIPLASGLGGSAASSVAAVVALDQLLTINLTERELLDYALVGEAVASGSKHGDNVAAALHGGLTAFMNHRGTAQIIPLPVPNDLEIIIIQPRLQINTKDARKVISERIGLKSVTRQQMALMEFITGCYENDLPRIANSLVDYIIEPQRKSLIPQFDLLRQTALDAGAMGYSISGAGPTMFAMVDSSSTADQVREDLNNLKAEVSYHYMVSQTKIRTKGAVVEEAS